MESYDLIVVGAGSGLTVANAAADRGETVAVVEEGPLGGTCLNRGCIPSKKLILHADVLETIRRADEFHIDASVDAVDFEAIVRDVNGDVAEEAEAIRRGLVASSEHDLYPDRARFVDERTLQVRPGEDGPRIEGDKIVLAAGTRPAIPPIDGLEEVDYLTSDEALELEGPPEELVIVGGGYIAAELAHLFGTFGTEMTIVGRRGRLLPEADAEVAEALTRRYEQRFTVHVGHEAQAVRRADGRIELRARPYPDADGEEAVTVTGDTLLVAAGRRPNTDRLEVGEAGIVTDEDGFVRTDKHLRTSARNVWALGDIVGTHLFKHAANHEAQIVAHNLYADDLTSAGRLPMPSAVFASPEVAAVGKREQELADNERTYATSTYRYEDTARGDAMHAEGFVKVIASEEGQILGCHIVGPDASVLIQEVVTAMTAGTGSVGDVLSSIHIHPALPEVVQRAIAGPYRLAGEHEHSDGEARSSQRSTPSPDEGIEEQTT